MFWVYYFCSLHLLAQTRFLPCALTISLDLNTICHGKNALNVFLKVFGFTQFLLMFLFAGMFDISCVCVYNVNYRTSCLSPSDNVWYSIFFGWTKFHQNVRKKLALWPLPRLLWMFWTKTPQPRSQGFELSSPDLEDLFSFKSQNRSKINNKKFIVIHVTM
jgi:hypothetical protein